ncbi:DNA polymerase III, delta subunit [uncultured Paludibacter sp.]|uniref:DNA polymerase III subunit delta n=1 Tax=uncultured Paludibacter sp. TaxID=497635 RepID=A0A653A5Z0_9BACT|nr:DNA polymerase III, delta subunit [uncultured Paludibacter sp.]
MAKSTSKYTFQDIMTDLRRKSYSPIYFLMGEEPYYIDQISDYLQDKVLSESEVDFNLTVLYGKDVNIDTVINIAKRYPMMAEYQVVIVKEAQQIKDWDNLIFYLQNPLKSTILCFCYKYGKPDGRKKWTVELNNHAVVFESKKLYENQIGAFIKDYLDNKNVKISEKAEVMLTEFLGTDLSKIVNEIDKLLLTKPADSHYITPELIETNIGISKDYNVFELQDALINRDVVKANRIIRYFGENKKENPLPMVLINLFSFFSNLMIYHYLPDKSTGKVSSELKIQPFFVGNYVKAAGVFNAWKTMNIITYIRETDARSKGIGDTGTEHEDLLKELIFKILH